MEGERPSGRLAYSPDAPAPLPMFHRSPLLSAACAAVCLWLALPAAAQVVNTEKLRLSDEVDGVALDIGGTFAYASGNTDYLQLGLGGRTDYRRDRDAAFVVGNLAFQRADGRAFLNEAFVHARYNRMLAPRLVAELFVQTQRNEAQLLERRYLGGAGLRAVVLRGPVGGVAVGVTPMLEIERLAPSANEGTVGRGRLSTYLTTRLLLGDVVSFSNTVYVQPSMSNWDDLRLFDEAQLDLAVTRYVRLRSRFNVRHDSRPPLGIDPTDVTLSNGIALTFPAASK